MLKVFAADKLRPQHFTIMQGRGKTHSQHIGAKTNEDGTWKDIFHHAHHI